MIVLEILFWIAAAWIVYVFVGYTLLITLLAKLRPKPIKKSREYTPTVAFVMAAYNEEKIIRERVQNYLDLDYPRHLLSFHIGSDASVDRTDDIIREFQASDPSIHLTRYNRSGKTKIVYELADAVDAEIIVFSDADIILEPEALRNIVECFADTEVGGVVVRIIYREQDANIGSQGEQKYHGMEDVLRRNESLFWSTVAPTGQCFAVRNGAYSPLQDYRLSDDLNLAITIPLHGKRVWYERSVVISETNKRTLWTEFNRRLRMGRQSAATFLAYTGTKFPWRSLTGFQIWSHKVLRNLAAIPALLFLTTALLLATQAMVYTIAAAFALVWGIGMLIGLINDRFKLNFPLINYPLYFTLMLLALTIGSIRAMFSGGLAMWSSQRLE